MKQAIMRVLSYLSMLLLIFHLGIGQPVRTPADGVKTIFKQTPADEQLYRYETTKKQKQLVAFRNAFFYDLTCELYLLALPEEISKWNKKERYSIPSLMDNYRKTFTQWPVFDKDLWYVNYVGHPYQGAFYYNTIRGQGGKVSTAVTNTLIQSLIWEYIWEGGRERPSAQDLVVTPVIGILIGEMAHKASLSLGRNGYTTGEKVLVTLINPAFLLNGNFKSVGKNPN